MEPVRVVVLDEHEIFRLGVVACLAEQPGVTVVDRFDPESADEPPDVAIASQTLAARCAVPCPLLVFVPHRSVRDVASPNNRLAGLLPVPTLTPERLLGAVRAAAAGLEVTVSEEVPTLDIGQRGLRVLCLLAEGADTRRIAEELGCSVRTVKADVRDLKRALLARSRAEVVAKAIRAGLI